MRWRLCRTSWSGPCGTWSWKTTATSRPPPSPSSCSSFLSCVRSTTCTRRSCSPSKFTREGPPVAQPHTSTSTCLWEPPPHLSLCLQPTRLCILVPRMYPYCFYLSHFVEETVQCLDKYWLAFSFYTQVHIFELFLVLLGWFFSILREWAQLIKVYKEMGRSKSHLIPK